MKKIIFLIALLAGLCSANMLAEVSLRQQADSLMVAAERYQEMTAKLPCGVKNGSVTVILKKECRGPFAIAITDSESGKVLLLGVVNKVPAIDWG